MKKKLLSLILAGMMLVLPACNQNTDPKSKDTDHPDSAADTSADSSGISESESDTETEPVDTSVADSLETVDFDGDSYVVFGCERSTGMVTVDAIDDESTLIQQAQYKAREAVQDRFNCKISYVEVGTGSDDDSYNLFSALHAGGDTSYAVGISRDSLMLSVATSGLSFNLTNIPQFDFSAPWWTKSTEDLAIGDQRRIASTFLSYTCLYYARMVVINKDMANDLHLTIPYEDVFAGTWYLDDMIALAAEAVSDVNGDGEYDNNDRYGWANGKDMLYTFQASLGVNFIVKDENNYPVFNNCIDEAQKYLEKMSTLSENHIIYTDSAGYGNSMLASGNTLMCYCNLREVCNDPIANCDVTYGFLPAPKLDETQEDYITSATDAFWAIPIISSSRVDFIGTITEALQCQHYNLVRPAFFETTMKKRLSDSPEDSQVLDIIPRTLTIDLDYTHGINLSSLFSGSSLTKIASQVKKNEASVTKKMQKLVENMEKLP